MAVFFGSYAFDRKKWPYSFFFGFFSTTCRNKYGLHTGDLRKGPKNNGHTGKYGQIREFDRKKAAIRGARYPLETSQCSVSGSGGIPYFDTSYEQLLSTLAATPRRNLCGCAKPWKDVHASLRGNKCLRGVAAYADFSRALLSRHNRPQASVR